MRAFLFPICVAMALLIPAAVQAMVITDITNNNTVLFSDNFEGAPGVSHAAAPDGMGDYNPVANIGSYLIQEDDPITGQVTAFSNATSAGPGAAQGSNYLRIYYNAPHEYQAELATTPASGDHINVKFMAYFTSNTGGNQAVFKIRGDGIGGDAQRAGGRAGEGGVVMDLNGDATSLTYPVGRWHEWTFDYVIGQSSYTMSVDGVSSGAISNLSRGGPGNIEGFGFWSGVTGTTFYLDGYGAVPEPGTLVLLITGLTGLVCYAWRKRR